MLQNTEFCLLQIGLRSPSPSTLCLHYRAIWSHQPSLLRFAWLRSGCVLSAWLRSGRVRSMRLRPCCIPSTRPRSGCIPAAAWLCPGCGLAAFWLRSGCVLAVFCARGGILAMLSTCDCVLAVGCVVAAFCACDCVLAAFCTPGCVFAALLGEHQAVPYTTGTAHKSNSTDTFDQPCATMQQCRACEICQAEMGWHSVRLAKIRWSPQGGRKRLATNVFHQSETNATLMPCARMLYVHTSMHCMLERGG